MREEAFDSLTDSTKIFVRSWRPQGPARGLLVIAHGFKAYGGLYGWTAEQLASRGISVYALDHRGHGNSGGERYTVGNISEYIADIDQLVELAKRREPGLPLFLLGHSAGGVMGCVYALEHPAKLAGFICESYALDVYAPGLALTMLKGLSYVVPHLHVLDLQNKRFSRDLAVVQALDDDPLIPQMKYPVGTVAALVRAADRVRSNLSRITLPVLIMHGTADKLTEPAGSQLFYDKAGAKDKTLKLYEGYAHDLLADIGKEHPLSDLSAWIDAHIVAAPVISV